MRFTNVLALALVALTPALGRADTCPPTATIGGPAALAQPLTKALVARGVQIEPAGLPAGPCPSLDVQVAATPGGFRVVIVDPWGRRAERALADVATAATLIETWARMELLSVTDTSSAAVPAAPVMVPPPPVTPTIEPAPAVEPAGGASAAAPGAETATRAASPDEAAPEPIDEELAASADGPADLALVPERSRLLVDLSGELGVARSREVWTGSALSACVRIGFTCVGALGRFAFAGDGDHRIDGLGIIAVPISLGRLTINPAIGAGVGMLQQERGFGGGGRGRDRGRGGDDDDERDSTKLRVEARLGLSLRLAETLHAELGASASTAPRFDRRFLGSAEDTIVRASVGLLWGAP